MERKSRAGKRSGSVVQGTVWAMVVAVTLALTPGAGRAAKAPKEIPVGVVMPTTGLGAEWGRMGIKCINYVFDQVNASGGIKSLGGAKLKLYVADTKGTPEGAREEMEKMIVSRRPVAVFGSSASAQTLTSSIISDKYGIPQFTASQSDVITKRGLKWIFQIAPVTDLYSDTCINFYAYMVKKTGVKPRKAAIIGEDSAYGQSNINLFKKKVSTQGLQIVDVAAYHGGQRDFGPTISRWKALGVDVVFAAMFASDGIQFTRDMKTLNFKPLAIIHSSGAPYTAEFLNNLKGTANNTLDAVVFSSGLGNKFPSVKKVIDGFIKKNGVPIDDYGASVLEGAGVFVDALETAKSTDPAKLRKAILATKHSIGEKKFAIIPNGVQFSPDGRNIAAMPLMMQILKERQEVVFPESLQTAAPIWPFPGWN